MGTVMHIAHISSSSINDSHATDHRNIHRKNVRSYSNGIYEPKNNRHASTTVSIISHLVLQIFALCVLSLTESFWLIQNWTAIEVRYLSLSLPLRSSFAHLSVCSVHFAGNCVLPAKNSMHGWKLVSIVVVWHKKRTFIAIFSGFIPFDYLGIFIPFHV